MSDQKPPMTESQKRLLWLVYIMGGVLIALFITAGCLAGCALYQDVFTVHDALPTRL